MNERGCDVPDPGRGGAHAELRGGVPARGLQLGTCSTARTRSTGLRIMDHAPRREDRTSWWGRSRSAWASGRGASAKLEPETPREPSAAVGAGLARRRGGAVATLSASADVAADVGARAAVLREQAWSRAWTSTTSTPTSTPSRCSGPVAVQEGQAENRGVRASSSRTKADARPRALKAKCRDEAILKADVVYGYFPVQSDGDDLIVFDAEDHDREIERFTFPRQGKNRRLCISDFFRSVDSGGKDVLPMHCVTVGHRASEEAKKLFEADEYTEYLYMHGLGVETAEALAELWHKRMRRSSASGGRRGAHQGPVHPEVPREPLLLRVPRLPRDERPGEALAPARARADRVRAHGELADRSGAEHQRDRRAPPGGEVLQRVASSDQRSAISDQRRATGRRASGGIGAKKRAGRSAHNNAHA
jgi:hypothetical protein